MTDHPIEISMDNVAQSDNLGFDDIVEPGKASELLQELRNEQGNREDSGKKAARRAMIRAYKIAQAAKLHDDVWLEICNDPIWEEVKFKQRPRHGNQADALRYAVRLSVGFHGVDATSIASKRYVAMKRAFQRDFPAPKVAKLLDKYGGAEQLAKQERNRMAKKIRPASEVLTLKLTGPLVNKLRDEGWRAFKIRISETKPRGKVIWAEAEGINGILLFPDEIAE